MYRQGSSHRNQDSNLRPPKMPERPLVPYMRFSKKMWPKVRADNPDSPIWDLGKIIGQLWNSTQPSEKAVYQQEYEAEKVEYEKAMKNYNSAYAQYMTSKSRVKGAQQEKGGTGSGRKGASEQNTVTGVFIQPVDDEDAFEMAGKRLAAIRYDRNNRLMAELFSPNYVPDPRTFVPQQRIEHFRKQGQSLEQHQNKLDDELAKLEELFNQRKRTIQQASEAYTENMKRVCDKKPQLDQEQYNKIEKEYREQLLMSWKIYEERQAVIQENIEADRRANPVLSDLITNKSPIVPAATEGNFLQLKNEADGLIANDGKHETGHERTNENGTTELDNRQEREHQGDNNNGEGTDNSNKTE